MKPKILIVEDERMSAIHLEAVVTDEGNYEVVDSVGTGVEALKVVESKEIDVILMDITLQPFEGVNWDGIETAQKIKKKYNMPIIFLTAYAEPEIINRAKLVSPHGYIMKPFQPQELLAAIEMGLYRAKAENEIYETQKSLIQVISDTVEARDPYTGGHQQRVSEIAILIANELKLDDDKCKGINISARIHDLGKIGVPIEILAKPAALTKPEFNLVQSHVDIGYDILAKINFPWFIADIVRQHHEKIDGSGYPLGLSGTQILLEAKIIAVADTLEAMASHRPYRPSLGLQTAMDELSTNRKTKYDTDVVDCLMEIDIEKIESILGK